MLSGGVLKNGICENVIYRNRIKVADKCVWRGKYAFIGQKWRGKYAFAGQKWRGKYAF